MRLSIHSITFSGHIWLIQEGIGITEILNAIVQRIPPPRNTVENPLRALIFDRFALVVYIHF